jgi:diguanylate cyclase (GGDEF)-like protein
MAKVAGSRLLATIALYIGIIFSASCAPPPSPLDRELDAIAERVYLAPKEVLYTLSTFTIAHPRLSLSHEARVRENLSRAKWHAKDFQGALHEAKLLEALGKQHGDQTLECLGILQQVYSYWMMGKIQTAYELSRRAEQFPPSAISTGARVRTLLTTAQVQSEDHRITAAQRTVAEAVRIAGTSHDSHLLFLAIKLQASLAILAHDIPFALATADRLVALARQSPHRERMVRADEVEYLVASAAGQTARASRVMDETIALMGALRLDEALGRTLVSYADLQIKSNRYLEAARLAKQALGLETVLADAPLATRAHFNHAIASIRLGNLAQGKTEVEQLLKSSRGRPQLLAQLLIYLPQYTAALTQAGDVDASVQADALTRQIDTEEALRRAKEDEKTQDQIEALARESRFRTLEAGSERKGRNLWLALTITSAIGLLGILVLYRRLRTSKRLLEETNRQLTISSNRDFLTGLFNRRYLENFVSNLSLEHGGVRAQAAAGAGLVLLMDIDHFKRLNDTYGHAAGDQALKATAQRLATLFGAGDLLARWGGEEFLAILPGAQAGEAAAIGARVLRAISAEPIVAGESAITVTMSLGICPLRLAMADRPAKWDEVLHIADQALYLSKQTGRNKAYAITTAANATSDEMARALHVNREEGKVELVEVAMDGA